MCDTCNRVVCSECISLPEEIEQAGGQFICPYCHKSDSTGKQRKIRPYKIGDHIVPFRGLATQRQLLSMSCTEPLVIMSIRPSKVSPHDLPARMVFDHLHPYLQGNIAYVDIDFNFSTTAFADSYEERLVSELRIGSLKRFQRFAIFLADKSPSGYRGTQVILIEDSKSLKELFQKVFLDEFCALLSPTMASTSKNMLTLLTRTDILSNAERFTFLKDLASRQYFAQIAAFTQPNLPACSTHEFILALHLGFHVYMRPGLDGTINEQDNLEARRSEVCVDPHHEEAIWAGTAGAVQWMWVYLSV
ncbi:unnamed protein product [Cyclocybe aegerita]|uniref:Uncharacterized protein n=1 Tax=Cyclocybe aegerita TaxID=1973307 RepID=A0A8S0WHC3_CYCAE|nr:unnamed protein product [Cyclocybe aegerita]